MLKKYFLLFFLFYSSIFSQESFRLTKVTNISDVIKRDGILNDSAWKEADSISFRTVEPVEGNLPENQTYIRILADSKTIVVGIRCYDAQPDKIVSISKSRDSFLFMEDHIKIIFDTKLDGRSGFVFAVNPTGTRYDALTTGSEFESTDWDGIWEAYTHIDDKGWSAELVIYINGLNFKEGLSEWGFNAQRQVKRIMEISRWTALKRDYNAGQMIHAGRIKNLPEFDYGIGTTVKLSGISKLNGKNGDAFKNTLDGSIDITQKITSDVVASLTLNTDFAETEVDTRQTNLTRFSLFFPEKRTFFLEGSDIMDFGFGVWDEIIPFFSRNIGLFRNETVPIVAGGKIFGRLGNTSFAALATRTKEVENLTPASTMGTIRVKQNILEQSNFGIIATFGDPQGNNDKYTIGFDFNFQTSKFLGNKNLNAGIWFLTANPENNISENSSYGFKFEYPNDLIVSSFGFKNIGKMFNPSLGFVMRNNVKVYYADIRFQPRPGWENIRQLFFNLDTKLITNNDTHEWESYEIESRPVNVLLESGDQFEFNIEFEGDRLMWEFPISNEINLEPGTYNWVNYEIEYFSAVKRNISGYVSYSTGTYYNINKNSFSCELNFRPSNSFSIMMNYEKNILTRDNLKSNIDLYGVKFQYNFTPDIQLSSFIQYDNDSKELGTNTRFRWTYSALGDLYIVYNHNIRHFEEQRWVFENNQFIIKFKYGFTI